MQSKFTLMRTALFCFALILVPVLDGAILVDPAGDTLGSGPVQYDIVSFEHTMIGANLQVHLEFLGPITPYDPTNPNSMFGYIEIDSDNDPSTGVRSPFTNLRGLDYVVILETHTFGGPMVPILSITTGPVGSGTITYGSNFLDLIVDGSLIGGSPSVNAAVAIGTITEQTDMVPNAAIPEPSSMLLVGTFLGTFVMCRSRSAA
jgi:hypothetical protein